MVKKLFNTTNKFYIFLFITLIASIYYYINNPIREGVVFTPYDNAKWFNKPWNQFCVQTPPSCQKNNEYANIAKGNPQIGCWCNDKQQAPLLDNNCTDIEFDPYIEYK